MRLPTALKALLAVAVLTAGFAPALAREAKEPSLTRGASTDTLLQLARDNHTMTELADGTLLIVGGRDDSGELRSTRIYDPESEAFQDGPDLRLARSGHSATLLADRRVLIAGGDAAGTAEVLDVLAGSSNLLEASMTEPRSRHSAILLTDGSVLLAGGIGNDGEALDTAEVFVEGEGFVKARGWLHARRELPDLVMLFDGKVQIRGGDEEASLEVFDRRGNYFRAQADPSIAATVLTQAELETDSSHGTAQISTDRIDYDYQGFPVISGQGWQPGEPIVIYRQPTRKGASMPTPLGAVADDAGRFRSEDLSPADHRPNTTWLLTAVGLTSGLIAQTAYYDAPTFDTDPSRLPTKPMRLEIEIPLQGGAGSAPTPAGELTWSDWKAAPAPAAGVSQDFINGDFDLSYLNEFAPCEICAGSDGVSFSCEGLDPPIVPEGDDFCAGLTSGSEFGVDACVTLTEFSGTMHVLGTMSATFDIDWGGNLCIPCDPLTALDCVFDDLGLPLPCLSCCGYHPWECSTSFNCEDCTPVVGWPCWDICCPWDLGCEELFVFCGGCGNPACCDCNPLDWNVYAEIVEIGGRVSLEANADPVLSALAEIDVAVSFEQALPIPFTGKKEFDIGGEIHGVIALGVIFGIEAGVEDAQLVLWLDPSVSAEAHAGYSSGGFDAGIDASATIEAGVDVVSLGTGYVEQRIGPEVRVCTDLFDVVAFDLGTKADYYTRGDALLDPILGNDGCAPWDVQLTTGVRGSARAAVFAEIFSGWGIEEDADTGSSDIWGPEEFGRFCGKGAIEVANRTYGADPDLDGYTVQVRRSHPEESVPFDGVRMFELPVNDEIMVEDDGVCKRLVGGDWDNCDLVATYHDLTLAGVMWNCSVMSGPPVRQKHPQRPDRRLEEVCLATRDPDTVTFHVFCESVFDSLANVVSEAGPVQLTTLPLLDELMALPRQAEKARNNGAIRESCSEVMAEFVERVNQAGVQGQLAPPLVAILAERGETVRSHYCD